MRFSDEKNSETWKTALSSMFDGLQIRDCTPTAILDTLKVMPRSSNKIDAIVFSARQRNIAACDESVLECLRTLYRDGKIGFREIAGYQFFLYPPK